MTDPRPDGGAVPPSPDPRYWNPDGSPRFHAPPQAGAYPPPQSSAYPPPQQGYAPPGYPSPADHLPGYPAPQYGWSGAPMAQVPYTPPPKRRRAPLVIAACVVVAAIVAAIGAYIARQPTVDAPGTDGRTLAVPASVPGLDPVGGGLAGAVKRQFGTGIGTSIGVDPQDAVRHAAVGVWDGTNPTLRVVFLGLDLRDIPRLRDEVRSDGVQSAVDEFVRGAALGAAQGMSDAREFDAGSLGGFMKCGTTSVSGTSAAICSWGDESAIALTIVSGTATLDDVAALTLRLRSLIESD